MTITPYSTSKVVPGNNIFEILDTSLPKLKEKDIVVVTSKIVSICQGRVVKNTVDKQELIRKEAQMYIEEPAISRFHVTLTIKEGILIANSGIDESNSGGYFILWPKEPFKEAQQIWQHVRKKYSIKNLGVIITDSRLVPLRWGTLGIVLSWCGFSPLKDYIGKPDIFGRKLRVTKQNIIDGLAAAAGVVMGEGNEQTPLAIIKNAPVHFLEKPSLPSVHIDLKDDMYAPLINSAKWKRGGSTA
ncbi:hypothetical protein A3A79_05685 [Candidatus Gottesmanbacteria bacterium RIFCSPLOWO2_01_FULL_43_11b]|uniref:Coenzyme F420:L-glutamate ligase-like domain-containing protein n=1 Tax=Candidatus Gottesmanbacteria bacterium RIFCSPLOWO2_01_FULL_43_11b TaxID=1798392 RepID=A0A1F6AIV2_9BACT|nr:MAG: hypothetical protein A3A79_05685 [Candidatus Gottesmanbacteria bacterium RIFCSPLOWO2_01_FULL_43_11b]